MQLGKQNNYTSIITTYITITKPLGNEWLRHKQNSGGNYFWTTTNNIYIDGLVQQVLLILKRNNQVQDLFLN